MAPARMALVTGLSTSLRGCFVDNVEHLTQRLFLRRRAMPNRRAFSAVSFMKADACQDIGKRTPHRRCSTSVIRKRLLLLFRQHMGTAEPFKDGNGYEAEQRVKHQTHPISGAVRGETSKTWRGSTKKKVRRPRPQHKYGCSRPRNSLATQLTKRPPDRCRKGRSSPSTGSSSDRMSVAQGPQQQRPRRIWSRLSSRGAAKDGEARHLGIEIPSLSTAYPSRRKLDHADFQWDCRQGRRRQVDRRARREAKLRR